MRCLCSLICITHYGADRQRWKQVYYNGTASETTLFVGGMLEKHTAGGITEYRHSSQADDQPVALYTRPTSGAVTTLYFLLDHRGSVAEIINNSGTLDVAESFAAFSAASLGHLVRPEHVQSRPRLRPIF